MADFIRIEGRKSNSELIINADTIEYMYEMTDRLGNISTFCFNLCFFKLC